MGGSGDRGDLLSQIQLGKSLRHTSSEEKAPVKSVDSRTNLLSDIQKGFQFKNHVQAPSAEAVKPASAPVLTGMAAALNAALQKHRTAMASDDERDEDKSDTDSDNWDDD